MDFFVSHMAEDRDWADWIAGHLEAAGYTFGLQRDATGYGADPLEPIEAAQQRGLNVVVVISELFVESLQLSGAPVVGRCNGPTPLIAVAIEDVPLPMSLQRARVVPLHAIAEDYDAARNTLLTAVGSVNAQPSRPSSAVAAHEAAHVGGSSTGVAPVLPQTNWSARPWEEEQQREPATESRPTSSYLWSDAPASPAATPDPFAVASPPPTLRPGEHTAEARDPFGAPAPPADDTNPFAPPAPPAGDTNPFAAPAPPAGDTNPFTPPAPPAGDAPGVGADAAPRPAPDAPPPPPGVGLAGLLSTLPGVDGAPSAPAPGEPGRDEGPRSGLAGLGSTLPGAPGPDGQPPSTPEPPARPGLAGLSPTMPPGDDAPPRSGLAGLGSTLGGTAPAGDRTDPATPPADRAPSAFTFGDADAPPAAGSPFSFGAVDTPDSPPSPFSFGAPEHPPAPGADATPADAAPTDASPAGDPADVTRPIAPFGAGDTPLAGRGTADGAWPGTGAPAADDTPRAGEPSGLLPPDGERGGLPHRRPTQAGGRPGSPDDASTGGSGASGGLLPPPFSSEATPPPAFGTNEPTPPPPPAFGGDQAAPPPPPPAFGTNEPTPPPPPAFAGDQPPPPPPPAFPGVDAPADAASAARDGTHPGTNGLSEPAASPQDTSGAGFSFGSRGEDGPAGPTPSEVPVTRPAATVWRLPHPRNPHFAARSDVLDRLSIDLVQAGADVGGSPQVQALTGTNGAGKSATATEHAYRHAHQLDIVWWVRAAGASTIRSDLAALADTLELRGDDPIAELRAHLGRTDQRWLLIMDDLGTWEDVQAYMPTSGRGQVLITSSNRNVHAGGELYDIVGFGRETARSFLLSRTGRNDAAGASELAERLGGLPAVLELAAAYLVRRGTPFGAYLHELADTRPPETIPEARPTTVVESCVAATIRALEKESPTAAAIAVAMSSLAGSELPKLLFAPVDHTTPRALDVLTVYGLVTSDGRTLTMHPLIQSALGSMRSRRSAEQSTLFLLELFVQALDEPWADRESNEISPHLLDVLDHASVHGIETPSRAQLTARAAQWLARQHEPRQAADLAREAIGLCERHLGPDDRTTLTSRRLLADLLVELGERREALAVQAKVLEDCERLNPNDTATMIARANLAANHQSLGEHERALPLAERAVAELDGVLGPDHAESRNARLTLGAGLAASGRAEEALAVRRRAAQGLDRSDPQSLTAREALLRSLFDTGADGEATALQAGLVDDLTAALGAGHPRTVEARSLRPRGPVAPPFPPEDRPSPAPAAPAPPPFGQSPLGPPPAGPPSSPPPIFDGAGPATLPTRPGADAGRAGPLLPPAPGPQPISPAGPLPPPPPAPDAPTLVPAAAGAADAEPLTAEALSQMLADLERRVGVDHPDVVATRTSLAAAYAERGDYMRAVQTYERVVRDADRVLGASDARTLNARNALANAYASAGDLQTALQIQERLVEDHERSHGPDHTTTLIAQHNLANSYSDLGMHERAMSMRERVLSLREQMLGTDHPQTLAARNNLANTYSDMGNEVQALRLRQTVLNDRERILGPSHPQTVGARSNLANSYAAVGEHQTALAIRQEVLTQREALSGPDHPHTIAARNNLANSYAASGDMPKALETRQRVLSDCERILGPSHPHTRTAASNLAESYAAIGDEERVNELRARAAGAAHAVGGSSADGRPGMWSDRP